MRIHIGADDKVTIRPGSDVPYKIDYAIVTTLWYQPSVFWYQPGDSTTMVIVEFAAPLTIGDT